MRHPLPLAALVLPLLAVLPARAHAQDWSPPSKQMPAMPHTAELKGNWLSSRASWFAGIDQVSGVQPSQLQAQGDARPGTDVAQVVRFVRGPLPVVVWADRNGDARADLVEIYRSGGVIIQLIDADYDGNANVLRIYDASGALVREDPV